MVRAELVGQTTAWASKHEQQRLGLSAVDSVVRIMRVRYRDEKPVAFEKIVLPLARLPTIAGDRVGTADLFELANKHGLALGLAREQVRMVRAGARIAEHLHIKAGARLLKLDRITFTADGTPIEWRISFSVPQDR